MPEKSSYEPGTPSWVDLGTEDPEAAAAFYASLFGWTHESAGPDAGGYGFFLSNGRQVAGVGPLMDPQQPPAWSSYITVEDVDATAQKVSDLGGQVVSPPMDLPGDSGRMAVFVDPTGAFISGFQPKQHKGAALVNEPVSLAWNEHTSRDSEKAQAFYSELFGWTFKRQGTDDKQGGDDEGPPYWTFHSESSGDAPLGGMLEMDENWPAGLPSFWGVYFAVEDADATVEKAKAEGATVHVEPFDTPPGRIANIGDPGNAAFYVIQLNPDFAP
jgi:predicted enzyme related to lactoylglutathione lyase